ncbi:ATP-grasp domain-containing protein [Psychroserpens ponticola]|uniref:ATP-grasp domain-containing protein n=1 Tax=Psychroserpens ponticola TaxID=2932268 RepID=A0ABY7RVH8_9FLAO|nr:ATP-grasp domain-containing protein [Psychroserpens ponticola]WCO01139.1 ATP-grasp domain-containing protein [Psychroserpens ponticola]
MKQKVILSIGAGYPQIDFIKSLKDKGHYVVAIGKGRNSEKAIQLCDEFAEVNTHNEAEVLNWIQSFSKKIDAVGSYSGGQAIRTLQVVNKALNLHTEIPTELMVGMDKFSQQELYEKYRLTTIASWNIKEITQNLNIIDGVNKFIVKPTVGRGSSGVEIVNKNDLISAINENKYGDETIVQEFREGLEYRVLALVQNGELKLLAPVVRDSYEGTVFLGRLSYDDKHSKRIEDYFMNFIKECGVQDVILKADILVSAENIDMIEMDIGVGGGTYYKQYLSKLFDYDLNSEYINLILKEQVSKANMPSESRLMDYVYNLSGKPIEINVIEIEKTLEPILGEHKILKNLLSPEKSGKFQSNADFIFTVIHKNKDLTNVELNKIVNEKLFKNG